MRKPIQAFLIIFTTVAIVSAAAVLWNHNTSASVETRLITSPPSVTMSVPVLPATPYEAFARDIQTAKFANTSTIALQFFGDIMLDRNVAKNMGTSGLNYIFANVNCHPDRPAVAGSGGISSTTISRDSSTALGMKSDCSKRMFGAADTLIANLEGPFAPSRVKTSKSIAFRFDPKLAAQLKAYGFHGFSLANNHAYDMERVNSTFTRDTLRKAGFGYFGDELKEGSELTWIAGETTPAPLLRKEGSPDLPLRRGDAEGSSVVLLENIAHIGLHNTYHELDLKKVEQTLLDAKSKARYVIVNIHWGEEYKRISNKKQRDLAYWLIDNGATAVIGHHPHVVQEMEIYNGAPIFYSLFWSKIASAVNERPATGGFFEMDGGE